MAAKTYQISLVEVQALADRLEARGRSVLTREALPEVKGDLMTAAAVIRLLSRPTLEWEISVETPER
jgi:hypothetical protein